MRSLAGMPQPLNSGFWAGIPKEPHLLQAICEEADGVSAQILHSFGVTPERLLVVLIDVRTTHHTHAPQAATHGRPDWEQRIEQQLARIETELAAIRSIFTQRTSTDTA